jgi:hypothetical protein
MPSIAHGPANKTNGKLFPILKSAMGIILFSTFFLVIFCNIALCRHNTKPETKSQLFLELAVLTTIS